MVLFRSSLILSFFVVLSSAAFPQPKVILETFATGFHMPVCIANAGDSRLFVVEQSGTIVIVDSTGYVNPVPFLDITDRVVSGGEQGLLGLVFHPDYTANHYFYVNYTGAGDSTHISRFSTSLSNPDSAVASSEIKILTIGQPFKNHNGGDIQFGPDGFLYIGMGDGGPDGDPGNHAQNLQLLLGKILRIDVNDGSLYTVPSSNPFAGHPDARGETWAVGFRNPWRFSFDRATGDLWIADVGESTWEEVDFQAAASGGGENYGWRCYEGISPFNTSGCQPAGVYTFPVFVYSHSATGGCAITGGYVYRGTRFPHLQGHYVFTDFCNDSLYTLYNHSGEWFLTRQSRYPGNNFSTFGEDANGELYVAGHTSGTLFHVAETTSGLGNAGMPGKMTISPNPFDQAVNIDLGSDHPFGTFLTVFDLEGKPVYRTCLYERHTILNLHFLSAGIYIVRMEEGEQTVYMKMVKVGL
jgi:glucose/arabinose dehydrogenase